MKKIENLTKEQETQLAVYRDRWLKIGLCTQPSDRLKAEDAIQQAYKVAALTPPKQIIWAASPLSGSLIVSILKNDKLMEKSYKEFKSKVKPTKLGDSVRDSVWASVGDSVRDSVTPSVWNSVRDSVADSVRDSVWDSVRNSVRDSVWDSVRDSVWASVWASVWDSVRDSVRDSVEDSVRDSVWASVEDSVRDSVWASVGYAVYGQQDAAWLGFYKYFLEVLKLESCKKLIPLMDLAQHANWWFPYKNVVVVSEKPNRCELHNGRIHSETGPAIAYNDGFKIYALNGIRVPEYLIETPVEQLDIKQILGEQNVDIRREGLKRVSVAKLLKETKARELDNWKNPAKAWCDYTLYEMDFGDKIKRKILRMKNPSLKDTYHYERVEDDIQTCKQALAWRMNLPTYLEPFILT